MYDSVRGLEETKKYDWDLVIVIPSHISEFTRRCAVRDGWARQLKGHEQNNRAGLRSIKLIFTAGAHYPDDDTKNTALAEMKQFGDMITLPSDFNDFYRNLATKTRLSIHEVVHRTNSFKLLLKVDTDSYVHVDRLLDFIDSNQLWDSSEPIYAGAFETSNVIWNPRDKDNKWYDGDFTELTGIEKYPWHAKGAGYMLSYKLAKYLSDPPIPLRDWVHEDVGIGAWLMPVSWRRVDMPVRFMEPQCDCATYCSSTIFNRNGDDPDELVVIDHYVPEYLHRWRQRRLELFNDSCWAPQAYNASNSPLDIEPSSLDKADYLPPFPMGFYKREYYFEPLKSRVKPPLIPSHADTRTGVCAISFTPEHSSSSESISFRAKKQYSICRGSDGFVYDDFECDAASQTGASSSTDWQDRSSSSDCRSDRAPLLERSSIDLEQCLELASIVDTDGHGWTMWWRDSQLCQVYSSNACSMKASPSSNQYDISRFAIFQHVRSSTSISLEPSQHRYSVPNSKYFDSMLLPILILFSFVFIPLLLRALCKATCCLPLVGRLRRNRRRRRSGTADTIQSVD